MDGIESDDVELVVSGGSILVNVTITVDEAYIADAAMDTLRLFSSYPGSLSAAIGIPVVELTEPVKERLDFLAPSPPPPRPPEPPSPPPPAPPPHVFRTLETYFVVAGFLVVVVCCGITCVCLTCCLPGSLTGRLPNIRRRKSKKGDFGERTWRDAKAWCGPAHGSAGGWHPQSQMSEPRSPLPISVSVAAPPTAADPLIAPSPMPVGTPIAAPTAVPIAALVAAQSISPMSAQPPELVRARAELAELARARAELVELLPSHLSQTLQPPPPHPSRMMVTDAEPSKSTPMKFVDDDSCNGDVRTETTASSDSLSLQSGRPAATAVHMRMREVYEISDDAPLTVSLADLRMYSEGKKQPAKLHPAADARRASGQRTYERRSEERRRIEERLASTRQRREDRHSTPSRPRRERSSEHRRARTDPHHINSLLDSSAFASAPFPGEDLTATSMDASDARQLMERIDATVQTFEKELEMRKAGAGTSSADQQQKRHGDRRTHKQRLQRDSEGRVLYQGRVRHTIRV